MNDMNINPIANDLIKAIDNFIEQSSKTAYKFTIEEQYKLQNKIAQLNNQIDILINYEIKREESE